MEVQQIDILIEDFKRENYLYCLLEERIKILLSQLLDLTNNNNIHLVASRVKKIDSFEDKVRRKNKYKNIKEITDLVGFRIITYLDDHVDIIAQLIEKEFIIDYENSVDKRKMDFNQFGYQSLHYVVSINHSRLAWPEYSIFKDLRFEIQIRTILQHSWATIEHKLGYKSEIAVPHNFKRAFSRMAALLELADIEFQKLKEDKERYEESIDKSIKEGSRNESIGIDQSSLQAFLENDPIYVKLEQKMAEINRFRIDYVKDDLSFHIKRLNKLDILTLKQFQEFISSNFDLLIEFSKVFRADVIYRDEQGFGMALSGFALYEIESLLSVKKDKVFEVHEGYRPDLIEIYNKIAIQG